MKAVTELGSDHAVESRGVSGLVPIRVAVSAVSSPQSTAELSRIMADAWRKRQPVYAVSTGRNWGYGASAPVRDGCVILDLSRMNQIGKLDTELELIHVQPGVTQGQLSDFLQDSGFMMDVTGAGPTTSIIGNTLERGFGHTPLGFRMRHFVISELVLADGTVVRPNEGLVEPGIGRVGLGAGLHELLTQSNLAVVTGMYVPVMRRPEQILCCLFSVPSTSLVPDYIDAVRVLKRENVLEGLPHLGNRSRVKGMFHGLKATPMAASVDDSWTGASGIYGTRGMVRAKVARIRRVLGKVARLRFISSGQVSLAKTLIGLMGRFNPARAGRLGELATRYEEGLRLLSLLEGCPSDIALRGCYVKNQRHEWCPGRDPVQDGCGFRWVAPALPMKGVEVKRFLDLSVAQFRAHGFELGTTLTPVTATLCQAIVSIHYDTDDADEWRRANELARELRTQFRSHGWPSYRLAIDEMEELVAHTDPALMRVRSAIKSAFDERGIVSPGRYCA